MLKSKWSTFGLAATAVAVLLTLPSISQAQRGGGRGGRGGDWGGRGGDWGGRGYDGWGRSGFGVYLGDPYYGGYGGYGRGYYDGSYYNGDSPTYTYSSNYYQPPAATAPQQSMEQNMTAMLHVRVPANAEFFIDNTPTQQQGSVRDFVSPPLTPGKNYSYNLRIRFTDSNGQSVERTRKVDVHAGDRINLNFLADASATQQSPPAAQPGARIENQNAAIQEQPAGRPVDANRPNLPPNANRPAATGEANPTTNLPNVNQSVNPPSPR